MKTSHSPALAVLLGCLAACSASAPAGGSSADGGASDDAGGPVTVATPDAGSPAATGDAAAPTATLDAGPACNEVAVSAPSVAYSLSNSASPAAATGGTIADGTYYLTSYTVFGAGSVGAGFIADQATSLTLQISAGTWSQAQVFTIQNTTSTVRSDVSVSTSGTSVTMTPTCPAGAATTGTYSATASAIQLVSQTSGFVVSETFAKQ